MYINSFSPEVLVLTFTRFTLVDSRGASQVGG